MKGIKMAALAATLLFGGNAMAAGLTVKVAKYKMDKACAISYTFDDGLEEQYTLAAPELEKRGFRGTFVINGSKINIDNSHITDTTRMTWQQVKELSDRGHEITNHGWAHRNLARFSAEEIAEDIYRNDGAIAAVTGIMPRTYAYPNNTMKGPGVEIATRNRVGTRTFQRSIGSKSSLQELDSWVDKLIQTRDWGIGMTHGLTYGYDCFRNPQRLWNHFDHVKAREDSIWVGTFREVAAYVKERDSIQIAVISDKLQLTITPTLSLDKNLFNEPLTMVILGKKVKAADAVQHNKPLTVINKKDKMLVEFLPFDGPVIIHFK